VATSCNLQALSIKLAVLKLHAYAAAFSPNATIKADTGNFVAARKRTIRYDTMDYINVRPKADE